MTYVKSLQVRVYTLFSDFSGISADNGQLAFAQDTELTYQYNGSSWIALVPITQLTTTANRFNANFVQNIL